MSLVTVFNEIILCGFVFLDEESNLKKIIVRIGLIVPEITRVKQISTKLDFIVLLVGSANVVLPD